jgi:hypothetical protein
LKKQKKQLERQREMQQKMKLLNSRLDFSTGGPFPAFTPLANRLQQFHSSNEGSGGGGGGQQSINPKWQVSEFFEFFVKFLVHLNNQKN